MTTDDLSLSDYITSSCAKQPGVIEPVITTPQRDVILYTFNLSADQLMELGRVERFGEAEFGVNRRFNETHAFNMAQSMLKPDTTFAENPKGSLENGWEYRDGKLYYETGAYIVLDDGQHRRGALELLNPEERARWSFLVTGMIGVPYRTRLMVFLQQDRGRKLDSRLKLQLQNELGEWDSESQARAYSLCVELANDPRSPLKDMIILEETDKRPYEGRHRPSGINVKGLHITFTSLMSRRSPLTQLSPEKQLEVCKNMVRAASHVWPHAWKSQRHVLTTAKGINAVLKLMISGTAFKLAVGTNFSYEHLVVVFQKAGKFDWGVKRSKNESEAALRDRLDAAIARALERDAAACFDPDEVTV